jgi:DNA topoisomerase-3
MQVYSTVFRRFAAVFCAEDCVVDKTEIKIQVGDYEEFTLKGTVIVEKGWTKYDDYTTKDKILPQLSKGDPVNVLFAPVEKETSPPKHYTIETLNNYLKNPFKTEKAQAQEAADPEKADDTEDYRAIFEGLELGTEATRTGIIDNARKSGYINLNKDVYTILPGGVYLIETLERMQISMDKYKTAEMGKALKKVYRGEFTIRDSIEVAKAEISEVFTEKAFAPSEDSDIGFFRQAVGTCPLCAGEVRRTTFGYGCGSYRENGCKFSINMAICGRTIPISAVKQLLLSGKTEKLTGFVSKKSGKSFDGALKLENGKVVFDFS